MASRDLTHNENFHFRDSLRAARDRAHKDTEDFSELLFAFERLGQVLCGHRGTLKTYKAKIEQLALKSPLAREIPNPAPEWHTEFSKLYESVSVARNDALHQGAYARHLTTHAVQLALVLEDALMQNRSLLSDFMIRSPVCAAMWQPLSFVRQQMLEHFSYLPVRDGTEWQLISDHAVSRYLRLAPNGNRKSRLVERLESAVENGLKLIVASLLSPDTPVDKVPVQDPHLPILVVDQEHTNHLLGILTPFDLL